MKKILLTDETVEKLGFEKIKAGQKLGKSMWSDKAVYDYHRLRLPNKTELVYRDGDVVITRFAGLTVYDHQPNPIYKYISSVKRLMEILKGDVEVAQ